VYSGGVSEQKKRRRLTRSKAIRGARGPLPIGAMKASPTGSGKVRRRTHAATTPGGASLPVMAVFLLLAGLGAAIFSVRLHNRSVDAGAVSPFAPATHAVVIVIDGADPAILNRVSMPNLAGLRQNGVTYTAAWAGQFETTASASAAAIGTGSFPRNDGVVGDLWYDAKNGHVVQPTLPQNVLVGSIDTVMEPTGVAGLAAQIKARRPTARILSVGGSNCAAAAAAGTWIADYIVCSQRAGGQWHPVAVAGHELPASATRALGTRSTGARRGQLVAEMQGWRPAEQDHWIAREAVNAMKDARPVLTFVSFPEIGILRRTVPAPRTASVERTILRGLDADIGRLVRESRREGTYKSTIFAITSGRAFEPIGKRMSYNHLSTAVVAAGGQATYLAGDGSALIGLRDPLQAQPVAQALQAENAGSIDALYFKSQTGTHWSYNAQYIAPRVTGAFARACSYLLSTAASATSPDVVVVYRPYAGLARSNQPANLFGALALQWPVQHVPLILAGHGVYAGRTSTFPARLVDIAPTFESELGLPVAAHDGIVLHDALYAATAGADVQSRERKLLDPLTAALRHRVVGVSP
jgi:hypothetical protein